MRVGGKRTRKFFRTQRAAAVWLRKTQARIKKEGEGAIHMPEALRVEAVKWAELLKPYGKTITDAGQHFLAHLAAIKRTCSVSQLIKEFVSMKTADGLRKKSVKDLSGRLTRFEIDFGERNVAELRTIEIDDWIRGLGLAPQSRKNYRTVLGNVFGFAVSREYAPTNPVALAASVRVAQGQIETFTPAEMRKLLEKAPRRLIPWLAIGGFAGLRSAEIERLDWKQIDLTNRLIHVTAAGAKTGDRRVATITDNLAQWIAPFVQKAGPVVNENEVAKDRTKAVEAAELTAWKGNALRHSFGSYHLAHFQDAGKTAFQMGHRSPTMLYRHYNGVATPQDAAQWWQIAPPADYGNVVAFSAEGTHG